MNLISTKNITKSEIENFISHASFLKRHPLQYRKYLNGKILATLFYQPSTRTRLSFESAMYKLGGNVISVENAKDSSSHFKGETIKDTLKVVSNYANAIVLRHGESSSFDSTVPLINGGNLYEHPTQALTDMFTLTREFGSIDGLKILFCGDLWNSRVIRSLLHCLHHYDYQPIFVANNENNDLKMKYKLYKNLYQAVKENSPDVVYMTRMQDTNTGLRKTYNENFIMTKEILGMLPDKSVILHPLPRREELEEFVDSDSRARYFSQAENGLYMRMSILHMLVNRY